MEVDMSEYGSGMTFKRACELDRERIIHALKGELVCDETDTGFVYADAPKEECDEFILSAFDNVVYHAEQAFHSGRALEKMLKDNDVSYDLKDYMKALDDTRM